MPAEPSTGVSATSDREFAKLAFLRSGSARCKASGSSTSRRRSASCKTAPPSHRPEGKIPGISSLPDVRLWHRKENKLSFATSPSVPLLQLRGTYIHVSLCIVLSDVKEQWTHCSIGPGMGWLAAWGGVHQVKAAGCPGRPQQRMGCHCCHSTARASIPANCNRPQPRTSSERRWYGIIWCQAQGTQRPGT